MILSLSQKSEGKRKFYGLVFERKSKVFVRERERERGVSEFRKENERKGSINRV